MKILNFANLLKAMQLAIKTYNQERKQDGSLGARRGKKAAEYAENLLGEESEKILMLLLAIFLSSSYKLKDKIIQQANNERVRIFETTSIPWSWDLAAQGIYYEAGGYPEFDNAWVVLDCYLTTEDLKSEVKRIFSDREEAEKQFHQDLNRLKKSLEGNTSEAQPGLFGSRVVELKEYKDFNPLGFVN